jgi:hypothetical protein
MTHSTRAVQEEVGHAEYLKSTHATFPHCGFRVRRPAGQDRSATVALITPVQRDEPVVFVAQDRDGDNGVLVTTDSARPADRRASRAADELGLSPTSIERLPFDLSVLDSGGVFINVDASNFGLLDRRLDWQALASHCRVALTSPSIRRAAVSFPDSYRLPLLRPAAQAHTALHRYSYHFRLVETLFETPAYRWLPWRAWPEFERELAAASQRFNAGAGRV